MSSIYDKASLVLIPSGTKTSKVYSQKPTNGDGDFTFSRSTAATRVNASGNIEKETQNLLVQSNSFNTTWFFNGFPTLTGGQSGYDGSSDAWSLAGTGIQYASVRQTIALSEVVTLSVYAKAGTQDFLAMNTGSSLTAAWFDLSNGTLGSTDTNVIDSAIESIGGGWYRCSMSIVGISEFRIYVTDADNNFGTAIGNIYIQDAQLNQGLIAQEVITTTTTAIYGGITDNVPRLDYTDSSCPSILLEPQRSNLVPFSEHLESSDWAKTRCTIEDNSTTSPEGVINASKMTSTDASESYIQDNLTTTGTKVTWSFFAKKGDLDYAHGLIWDLSANGCRQWFNLSTGAVGGTTTFGSGYSVDSATIEDYGNGWYRCAMVVNSTAGTQGCRVNISSADTTISSAVNSYGYFYGIQLEDASYATSYIPTYGSAVTRNADLCNKTGVSSLIGQTEGTLFAQVGEFPKENNGRILGISDGSSSNYVIIIKNSTNTDFAVYATNGGTAQATYLGTSSLNDNSKIAVGYANNNYVVYVNGTQVHSDTSASVPTCSNIYIGQRENGSGTYLAGGSVKQSLVFKTRLSNQELQDLTTL